MRNSGGRTVGLLSAILTLAMAQPSLAGRPTGGGGGGKKTTTTTTSTSSSSSTSSSTSSSSTSTSSTSTTSTTRPNQPPFANAGPDRTATVNVALTINGSGSVDPDGTIATYWWTFGDGGSATVATPTVSHTYAATGTYTVSLWVRDNAGTWSTSADTAIFTIGTATTTTGPTTTSTTAPTTPTTTSTSTTRPSTTTAPQATTSTSTSTSTSTTRANQPPHADAGPDQAVPQGVAAGLNGSASTDSDGFITTYTWNFGDGSNGSGMAMSHLYAAPGVYTATLTVVDNLGAMSGDTTVVTVNGPTWARGLGTTGNDTATAVAVDPSGNTVVAGAYRGTMIVGTKTLTNAGNADMFIVKYSAAGGVLWATGVGGPGDESAQGVAIDPTTGDVVVAGWFTGTANFGGTSFAANGAQDMVLAKYSGATGLLLWAKQFGGTYEDAADAVAIDSNHNIVLTGYFKNTISFGGTTLHTPQITDPDVFLAKFDSAGGHLWSKNFYNTAGEEGCGVAVDANGNIALAGWFTGTFNLGGTQLFAANGLPDGFVARFDPNGTHTWSRKIGGGTPEDYDFAYAVAMDGSGNVVVTGAVGGAVDFGGGVLSALGGADAYVAKYTATAGAHLWSRRLGGAGADRGLGVTVDANGNVLVTGAFSGTASFGGTSLTAVGTAGATDAFLAKYSSGGAPSWARQFGAASDDIGQAVAVASTGHPVVAGVFRNSAVFEGATLTSLGLGDGLLDRGAP